MRTKVPELYRLLNEYCVHVHHDHIHLCVHYIRNKLPIPNNVIIEILCNPDTDKVYYLSRLRILNDIYIFYSAVR